MEFRLRPLDFMLFFFYKTTIFRHIENDDCCFVKELHETQGSLSKFHGIKYIYLIYIYLSLSYNSSISDSEHSPNYIALGSLQTHKVI